MPTVGHSPLLPATSFLLLAALLGGCVYTKAPSFPEIRNEGTQALARIEFTTREVNPEDGPLTPGLHGWRYCASPPCTVVDAGEVHVLARAPLTWIELAYLRVNQPAQGMVQLTHEAQRDGRRRRIDVGHGHQQDLVLDLAAISRLYGLGKGDLIELSIHAEQSNQVERYYFERRPVQGNGLPDRLDLDVAVGVLPIPEGARDLERDRTRADVGRSLFPLALQLSLGWNTVRRASPWAEFADRLDLVIGLAIINFQGLPSGIESKIAPAIGPGIRIHQLFNFLWYFDLFGKDPVSFPALAISVDESLQVASRVLSTDVIYKEAQPKRFRLTLQGGGATSWEDISAPWTLYGEDPSVFALGHFSFGRRWSDHWTFAQVDGGVIYIPQRGSDSSLVLLQITLGPRVDLPLWQGRVVPFAAAQGGFYQGYLLREDAASEVRLRSGFLFTGGLSVPIFREGPIATWSLVLNTSLHAIYDFAGAGDWTRLSATELGVAVEF